MKNKIKIIAFSIITLSLLFYSAPVFARSYCTSTETITGLNILVNCPAGQHIEDNTCVSDAANNWQGNIFNGYNLGLTVTFIYEILVKNLFIITVLI